MRLHTQPHTVVHCIPLPRDVGDLAPIYFKVSWAVKDLALIYPKFCLRLPSFAQCDYTNFASQNLPLLFNIFLHSYCIYSHSETEDIE